MVNQWASSDHIIMTGLFHAAIIGGFILSAILIVNVAPILNKIWAIRVWLVYFGICILLVLLMGNRWIFTPDTTPWLFQYRPDTKDWISHPLHFIWACGLATLIPIVNNMWFIGGGIWLSLVIMYLRWTLT
jgi:hypothetical protein